MKLARRSTGSLFLPVLAVILGVAFSAWCISLAFSVQTLRADAARDGEVLTAIEDLRGIVFDLDNVAMLPAGDTAEPASQRWRSTFLRVDERLARLGDRSRYSEIARGQIYAVESMLVGVNEAGLRLTSAGPDDPAHRELRGLFVGGHQRTHKAFAVAVGALRAEMDGIFAELGRKWRSLNILAFLSVGTVVLSILLLNRARLDAARHKESEESLRTSEERFRSVLTAVPDLIIVLSAGGRYRNVYTADPELLIGPVDDILGRSIHEVLPAEAAGHVQAVIDRALETRRMQSCEYELPIAEQIKWFSARVVPFGDPDDPCVLWVARDITDRRLGEQQLRESEMRFRRVAENIDEVISLAPIKGRGIEYVSPAYEAIWGRPCQELYDDPTSWQDAIHEDDRERVLDAFERGAASGSFDEEFRIVRDDGTIRWVRDRSFPIHDEKGNLYRMAGLTHDITERKLYEEELREREERLRSVIGMASDAVIVADEQGRIVLWNQASEEIFGYEPEEALGQSLRMIMPARFQDAHQSGLTRAGATTSKRKARPGGTMEVTGLRKDGTEFPIELSMTTWKTGKGTFFTGIVRDITERKAGEEALRESEQRFRSAFDGTAVGMALADPRGAFLEANHAFCEMLGYSEQQLCGGMAIRDITHPDDVDISQRHVQQLLDGDRTDFTIEKRYLRRDGKVLWALTSVAAVRDAAGRPLYLVGETQDITQQKAAEQALREANEELEQRVQERTRELVAANQQLITENTDRIRAENIQRGRNRVLQALAGGAPLTEILSVLLDGIEEVYPRMISSILLLDESGRHLTTGAARRLPEFYNEAIDGLEIGLGVGSCGTAAATGRRVVVTDVMSHPYWSGYRDIARRAGIRACWSEPIMSSSGEVLGTFAIYYSEPRGPSDSDLEFIASAANIAGIAIQRKKAEAELKESQERLLVADRLASLGTMAAGLGHDMSNVLFPIRCRLDALDWNSVPPELKDLLVSSRDSVEYLQHLCNGLRLFAADPDGEAATVDVTSLPVWWRNVEPLITKLLPDTVSIEAAIPENVPLVTLAPHRLTQAMMNLVVNAAESMPDGGQVRIWAKSNGNAGCVRIGVTDQGAGMSEQVRQRALDPFFTTKTRGLSTGLGLSLVHGLVRRARGSIDITSAPGGPTTVCLTLPQAKPSALAASGPHRGGNGDRVQAAVTLADPRTAAWVTNILESMGYLVTVVADGEPKDCDIWVTEPTEEHEADARAFLAGRRNRRIIALGPAGTAWTILGAVVVQHVNNLEAIKAAVCEVTPVQS